LAACSRSPAPAPAPTPGAIPSPAAEIALRPEQVRFDREGIAAAIRVERRPATRLTSHPAPGTQASPAKLLVIFDPATLADPALPESRALIIYPASDWSRTYARLGRAADDPLPGLKKALDDEPQALTIELPPAPGHLGAREIWRAQAHYLEFHKGRGVRYLTVYQADPLPVTNTDVIYVFHGLSDDGKYWVTLYFPLTTRLLPAPDAALAALADYDRFVAQQAQYREDIRRKLAAGRPEDFTPRLDRLDALLQSVAID
jgi:hypothetical protein